MVLTIIRSYWHKMGARRLWIGGALLLFLLAGAGAWWYVAAEDQVCLIVGDRATLTKTRAAKVGDLLKSAGVKIGPADQVTPPVEARIGEGLTIRVQLAFPVNLVVGGETSRVMTVACPVSELLAGKGVALGADDQVQPNLSQIVRPEQTVKVTRVATKILTYREQISPEVMQKKDPNLDRGSRRVIKEGRAGLVERTAKLRLEDGRERGREILTTTWLRRPEVRVVAIGTRPLVFSFITSRGQVVRYTKALNMTSTGYDPGPISCGPGAKGITRTGAKATYGVVAVDPRVIPLGTRLYVEGYGFATALDTGSAIKGLRIDLCFDTYREASMYGKRRIKVYIIAP